MMVIKKKSGRKPRPALTIAVDAGALSQDGKKNKGGIATIAYNLLKTLSSLDERNTYLLYSFAPLDKHLIQTFSGRAHTIILWPAKGYKSVRLPIDLRMRSADVFIGLSQAIPDISVPALGFVYDLAFLHFPDFYAHQKKLQKITEETISRSRHLITISHSSKKDIVEKYSVPDEKISVVYPGVSELYTPHGPKYVGDLPYFLYTGHMKKIKNIPRLLTGFHTFLQQSPKQYKLVLIGSRESEDPEIAKTIKQLKLEKMVMIKGYVSIHELPKYYRGATAFVSPSLYEGFGLPIIEAMACGIPVIVGTSGSQPEVAGRAGLLVHPEQPDQIAEVLLSVSENEKLRWQLAKKGLKQTKKFTWHQFTRGVLEVIYEMEKLS